MHNFSEQRKFVKFLCNQIVVSLQFFPPTQTQNGVKNNITEGNRNEKRRYAEKT